MLMACLLFLLAARLILLFTGPPEEEYSPGNATVYGTVEKKELKGDQQVFYLKDVGIAGSGQQNKQLNSGLICVTDSDMPPIGARVKVRGNIWLYPLATNPGEFDMRDYYLCMGYGGRLSVHEWSLAGDSYSPWREGLWNLRCFLGGIYEKLLPEEDSAVLKAIILGDKGDLSAEIKDLYRAAGISHILAISGLHISILGMSLYKLLRRSGLHVLPSAATAVFVMVNYAVLTGAGTSTVRAVSMFALMAVADVERRSYDLPTALGLSAASAIVTNPYLLMTASFWLSYSAVTGVAIFGPALWGELRADDKKLRKLLQAIGASFSVSVFTLPLILSFYYEFPVYSVMLNLIVIPLMSILMVFGLIMLICGVFWLPAGIVMGIPCHFILKLYTFLCEGVSQLPGNIFIAGAPPVWKLIAAYAVFFVIIFADKRRLIKYLRLKKEPDQRMLAAIKLLMCALVVSMLLLRGRDPFRLSMLDVGQGDGFCIETPGLVCMIDGGSTDKDKLYQYQLAPFLKYEGIRRVDLWFVTHPDRDHISGLMDMLSDPDCHIKIGAIVLPDAKGAEEDFYEMICLARDKGTEIYYNSAGKKLEYRGLVIRCLHPAAGYVCEDVNEYSQILEIISTAGFSGIFTGDATAESEAAVISSAGLYEAEGSSVVSGAQEADGSLGKSGADGRFGASGADGRFGASGADGSSGASGADGSLGNSGADGSLGKSGADGSSGASGVSLLSLPGGGYDVLKLGHHGSHTSSTQGFLDLIRPRSVLISCGRDNPYGHPHKEVLDRVTAMNCDIYRTDHGGCITIIQDGNGLKYRVFCE